MGNPCDSKAALLLETLPDKKLVSLLFRATGLSPPRRRAERWVCPWCLPTLGPCLPNIYERDPVIVRQAFRRKHSGSRSQGGSGGCSLPRSLGPRGAAGVCPSLQHHLAGPPRLPGAADPGESAGGLTKEPGYGWPRGWNPPRLGWYLPRSPMDTTGQRGSPLLPPGFCCCSQRVRKTAVPIFALASPSV